MEDGEYLIVEYAPQLLDNEDFRPVRMDGHYADRDTAEEIAKKWAEESSHKQTRIIVVQVVAQAKKPESWKKSS